MKRRNFVNQTILGAGALAVAPTLLSASATPRNSNRPPVSKRLFRSEAVEEEIVRIKKDIADPEIAWL